MMIWISDHGWRASSPAAGGPPQRPGKLRHGRPHLRQAGCGALAGAVRLAGCAGGRPAPAGTTPRHGPGRAAPAAAAFSTAWAGAGAVHDGPPSFAARCAPLATASATRQLAASQPPAAARPAMRGKHLASLVQVRAVTCPDAGPAPARPVMYLRAGATRVTVTTAGRDTARGGDTIQLTRTGARWLASAVLSW